jgi:hypothetical protein
MKPVLKAGWLVFGLACLIGARVVEGKGANLHIDVPKSVAAGATFRIHARGFSGA